MRRLFRRSSGNRPGIQPTVDPRVLLGGLPTAVRINWDELCVLARSFQTLAGAVYLGEYAALCRVLGFYKLYVDTRDTGFACHLLLDGFWELGLTLCVARNVRPGMTAIDVGANFGYYTLILGGLVGAEGCVYSVEPNPAAAAMLRRSVDLNGMATRTTVIEAAAGAVDGGEVLLHVPRNEPKNASVIGSAGSAASDSGTLHHVRQVRIDTVAAKVKRVDFIKVDVEGAEEAVIAGLMEVLRRDRPCLVLEFNAARCQDADALLGTIGAIYDGLHYLDPCGNSVETSVTQLKTERLAEDWLLFFSDPARLARD
jgi:FkbM family methyltransferase